MWLEIMPGSLVASPDPLIRRVVMDSSARFRHSLTGEGNGGEEGCLARFFLVRPV